MTTYLPPKCPTCDAYLNSVNETEHNTYTFDPLTGTYKQRAYDGALTTFCPNCGSDVYDALQDAACNYNSYEMQPCQPQTNPS
jgi:phage FluMu protein Com